MCIEHTATGDTALLHLSAGAALGQRGSHGGGGEEGGEEGLEEHFVKFYFGCWFEV